MNFLKINQKPLIYDDVTALKDSMKDNYKDADEKQKTEVAIVKSIIEKHYFE